MTDAEQIADLTKRLSEADYEKEKLQECAWTWEAEAESHLSAFRVSNSVIANKEHQITALQKQIDLLTKLHSEFEEHLRLTEQARWDELARLRTENATLQKKNDDLCNVGDELAKRVGELTSRCADKSRANDELRRRLAAAEALLNDSVFNYHCGSVSFEREDFHQKWIVSNDETGDIICENDETETVFDDWYSAYLAAVSAGWIVEQPQPTKELSSDT